jgi:hypothetical protein
MRIVIASVALAMSLSSHASPARAASDDGGWPRSYQTTSRAHITLYQPQVASWPDQKHMTLHAAVAYLSPGAQHPTLGSIEIESDTKVALDERLVNFSEFKITEASFPRLQRDAATTIAGELVGTILREQRVIGLDRVMASVNTSEISPKNVDGLKADPPQVFVNDTPAVLVNLDGDPIWSPIAQNNLRVAVNTNWAAFAPEAIARAGEASAEAAGALVVVVGALAAAGSVAAAADASRVRARRPRVQWQGAG